MAILDEVLPSGVRASKQGSPRYDASVAQLVEQRFRNPQVVGSTPTAGPSTNMFLLNNLLNFLHHCALLNCRLCSPSDRGLFTYSIIG